MTQSLTLSLTKPGERPQGLRLNLAKAERFKVRLSWDGGADVDLHALVARDFGQGAKVAEYGDLLSTYNVQRNVPGHGTQGTLPLAADKTFSVHNGALVHSPDATDGHGDGDDEFIIIHPDRLTPPAGAVIEIPLIATIHPQSSGQKFRNVQNPHVIIENAAGAALLDVNLGAQFADFVGVQMGSIIIDQNGASFAPVGKGFNSDFNEVVAAFS